MLVYCAPVVSVILMFPAVILAQRVFPPLQVFVPGTFANFVVNGCIYGWHVIVVDVVFSGAIVSVYDGRTLKNLVKAGDTTTIANGHG
jgi:hypothetical protein